MTHKMPPTPGISLEDAKDWLEDHIDEGAQCPCCSQYAKVYERTLPSATARVMIRLYQHNKGIDYVYLPTILDTMKGTPHQGGYGTLGHHWGLMEQMPGERPDGSNRVGWWRLTDLGRDFVRGIETVPKTAYLYSGRCLTVGGPPWSVRDALGHRFNYDELMEGAA